MRLLAGIDAGGTHTRLALVQEDGLVLGYAQGESMCFAGRGLDQARQTLADLWRGAWQSAGMPPRAADTLFMGSGSVLSAADARICCDLVVALGLTQPASVRSENDAWNALAASLAGRPGILLISGTGSACFGRNAQRELWRAGGWGYLLNDVGSAYALGVDALIAATRDADGRGPATSLKSLVREALGLSDLKEIFGKVHHGGMSRTEVAALAPQVVAHAQAGDQVALRILETGADGLVEMAVTVARQLGMARPELALAGGLISNAACFRAMILERLGRSLPGFRLAAARFAPVFGAVMLALELATGREPPAPFLENVHRSAALRAINP